MDIAYYERSVVNINTELSQVEVYEQEEAIKKFKRIAEKGGMSCPFCGEKLLFRAGEIREIHFAHLPGKTCLESEAYNTYRVQTGRENRPKRTARGTHSWRELG